MVDPDIRAVRLSQRNLEVNRIENGHVVLSDGLRDLPKGLKFDLILSNPPTHEGKLLLERLTSESHSALRPGGSMWIVVNRLLSVRDVMASCFGGAEVVARHHGFIVIRSQKPRLTRTYIGR